MTHLKQVKPEFLKFSVMLLQANLIISLSILNIKHEFTFFPHVL